MNRTLCTLTVGALLAVLTACTAEAPAGVTLDPLTEKLAESSSSVPDSSVAVTTGSTTESSTAAPTTADVTSEATSEAPTSSPVEVVVPPEASALPLPTEQINIPADSPQEEADRAAIEAVWRQVWDLYRNGYQLTESEIQKTANRLMTDPVRSQFVDGLIAGRTDGIIGKGVIAVSPYWYMDIDGLPYAAMGDCSDFSRFGTGPAGTDEQTSTGKSAINSVGYFLKDSSGQWRLWQVANLADETCVAP